VGEIQLQVVEPEERDGYLSLRMVHSSPPGQASSSMYRYFLSLKVRYSLHTNNTLVTTWRAAGTCSQ